MLAHSQFFAIFHILSEEILMINHRGAVNLADKSVTLIETGYLLFFLLGDM